MSGGSSGASKVIATCLVLIVLAGVGIGVALMVQRHHKAEREKYRYQAEIYCTLDHNEADYIYTQEFKNCVNDQIDSLIANAP